MLKQIARKFINPRDVCAKGVINDKSRLVAFRNHHSNLHDYKESRLIVPESVSPGIGFGISFKVPVFTEIGASKLDDVYWLLFLYYGVR